jgi:hypothetical protein
MCADSSIAVTPKYIIDENIEYFDTRRNSAVPDFGVWVEGKQGSQEGIFLAHGPEGIMRKIFGNIIKEVPMKLNDLSTPVPVSSTSRREHCVIL